MVCCGLTVELTTYYHLRNKLEASSCYKERVTARPEVPRHLRLMTQLTPEPVVFTKALSREAIAADNW
jgi:hypothetical protein